MLEAFLTPDFMLKASALFGVLAALYRFASNHASGVKQRLSRIDHNVDLLMQMFYAVVSDSHTAHFHSDSKGQFVWTNRAYQRLAGMTQEESAGNGWITAIAPKHRAEVSDEWRSSVEQERDFAMPYVELQNPRNGKTLAIRVFAKVMKVSSEEGMKVVGHFGTAQLAEKADERCPDSL